MPKMTPKQIRKHLPELLVLHFLSMAAKVAHNSKSDFYTNAAKRLTKGR